MTGFSYKLKPERDLPIGSEIIDQKAKYNHNHPVEGGFVNEPGNWKYGRPNDYSNRAGLLNIY